MNAILAWLATYAVHSTLLLGVVALLTAFVIRREAWRDTLWKVALLGGLVTASLQLAFGIRPLVGRLELPQSSASVRASQAAAESDGVPGWSAARDRGAASPTAGPPRGPGLAGE